MAPLFPPEFPQEPIIGPALYNHPTALIADCQCASGITMRPGHQFDSITFFKHGPSREFSRDKRNPPNEVRVGKARSLILIMATINSNGYTGIKTDGRC